MNHPKTFVLAMTVTACFTFANRLLIGSDESDVRPLAKSRGVATINECQVRGRIESRPQGVYAVFEFENTTEAEKEIKLNYLATRTAPMSMLSRMGPRPETVKKGTLECHVKTGSTTEEVLLKEQAPAKAEMPATGGVAKVEMKMTPEIWSLVVSREEIKRIHGWGAVGPAASDATISLDKGEAVLAVTVPEPNP
jgi:hypothetical protein